MSKDERIYAMDWLRVIATFCVFIFHSCRFFDYDDWHVKNPTPNELLAMIATILIQWLMPIFFMLSGASTWIVLRRQTHKQFVASKVSRLLIPLIFGVFILSPHCVYLERLTHGQFHGSLLDFLPSYFQGMYGFGGNFAWMGLHLWYVLLLFIFSLLTLPLFARSDFRGVLSDKATALLKKPGAFLLLAVPLAGLESLLNPDSIGTRQLGGWSPFVYLIFYLYGYVFLSRPEVRTAFTNQWKLAAYFAITIPAVIILLGIDTDSAKYPSLLWSGWDMLRNINTICWLVAIIGAAHRYLNFSNALLKKTQDAVMPFYMLHQPVLLIVGYFVVRTELGVLYKFLTISGLSFAIIVGIYELLISPNNLLRVLFGIKPIGRTIATADSVKRIL